MTEQELADLRQAASEAKDADDGDYWAGQAYLLLDEVERLREELLDTRKVVKLILGQQYNLPWTEVSDRDVEFFVRFIRKQREAATTAKEET